MTRSEAVEMILRGAMSSMPGGMTCVRHLSHLPDDCQEAFGEPRCPQCLITTGAVVLADLAAAAAVPSTPHFLVRYDIVIKEKP